MIFFPGADEPPPRAPLRTMQPGPHGYAPKPSRGLGSPAANSSRAHAALAGSALMGTLNPDPASPARLEARLADAGARSRSLNGSPSPYGLMGSPAAHMLPPQRAVQGDRRRSGARPLPSYGTSVQRPSRASQPRARFPTQFPVHQQVHQPPRARQGQARSRHVEHFPQQRAAPHHGHGHGHGRGHRSESSYLHQQLPPRPVQPQTTDRPQTADPSVALDREEYKAAFSELDELRGLAAADPKDAGRFETAARPMTAPSAPLEVPAEYLQAAPAARPGTSAGGRVETEEELRVRLLAAESVMRKLYRRNSQLEEEHKEQQRPATSGGLMARDAGPGTPAARPQTSAGLPGAEGEGEGEGIGMSAANEHALYLLRQKESDLQRMKEYTAGLHAQLTEATALGATNNASAGNPTANAAAAAAAEANAEYRERYMRMRGEYRQLLRSRADSLKRSSHHSMDREQQALLGQMEMALQDEADLHRSESQRLNEELYLQEKRQCDWYVEKHTLETAMGGMQQELAQRDELDGEIESKMAALFSRMKRLEDENIQLAETNEVLRRDNPGEAAASTEASAGA